MAINRDKPRVCRINSEIDKAIEIANKDDIPGQYRKIGKYKKYIDAENYREIEEIKKKLKQERQKIKDPHWQLKIEGFELD